MVREIFEAGLKQTIKDISQMTNSHPQLDIARRFHAALAARDWNALRVLLTDDATG